MSENGASRSRPRILTHLSLRLLEPVAQAHPDLEIIRVPSDEPLAEDLRGDILLTLTWGGPHLAELLERGVSWIHVYGTGVDRFPFDLLGNVPLTCSRGASAKAISEWVLAAMLAAEKDFPESWIDEPTDRWNAAKLGTLEGRKLALVGFGGIAQAVARRAMPFEMRIEALRRTQASSPIEGVTLVSNLEELLSDADHIVIAAPETRATHHLFDDAAFAAMKPGAHLVNIARGGLVDQDALERALEAGQVGRASLDCVTPEPLPEGHWFYRHPRVFLTPHISWSTPESYSGLVETFVENVGRFRRGEELLSRVDPDEGY
jgi:phosphoglycerate dehydrogenase-like enzyme